MPENNGPVILATVEKFIALTLVYVGITTLSSINYTKLNVIVITCGMYYTYTA